MSRGGRSAGLTLVELLVVMAVIGLLVAILLPAVQMARGSARRAQCGNQLKQIGIAVESYLGARGSYPPGNVALKAGICYGDSVAGVGYPSQDGTNWLISILPQLDQEPLFRGYAFSEFNESAANAAIRSAVVPTYVCPADLKPDQSQMPATGPASGGALKLRYMPGSYRAVSGRSDGVTFLDSGDSSGYPRKWRGAIHTIGIWNYKTEQARDLRDGASHTLLAGESTTTSNPAFRTLWAYSYAFYSLSAATPQARIRLGDYDQCVAQAGNGGSLPCRRGWGSNHGGGQNFLVCDGSVRFVSNELDPEIFAQLATIDGGEATDWP